MIDDMVSFSASSDLTEPPIREAHRRRTTLYRVSIDKDHTTRPWDVLPNRQLCQGSVTDLKSPVSASLIADQQPSRNLPLNKIRVVIPIGALKTGLYNVSILSRCWSRVLACLSHATSLSDPSCMSHRRRPRSRPAYYCTCITSGRAIRSRSIYFSCISTII